MRALLRFLRRPIDEIAADPALRIYGALLALTHVLTFIHWKTDYPVARWISRDAGAICWPFFEDCAEYRLLDESGAGLVLWVYLGVAVLTLLLFTHRRLIVPAYLVFLILNLFKVFIWIQDYRLRLNQHYMAFFVSAVFLFLPNKRRLLQYLIVFFYFWAGTLKLHPEWLSGKALYAKPLLVPEALVPAACVYVLVLEMVLVFGLLARRRWIFWAVFAQLILFHTTSFPVVGFFYPLLMYLLLAIFPLARAFGGQDEHPSLGRVFRRGGEPTSTRLFLGFYTVLQLLPWVFPGDTAVTGEGRLFALHMFDAKIECEAQITIHEKQGPTIVPLDLSAGIKRIRCDPIVYLFLARGMCRKANRTRADFIDLDLLLRSRRSHEQALRPVIDVKAFCARRPEYDLLRPNPWILKD